MRFIVEAVKLFSQMEGDLTGENWFYSGDCHMISQMEGDKTGENALYSRGCQAVLTDGR